MKYIYTTGIVVLYLIVMTCLNYKMSEVNISSEDTEQVLLLQNNNVVIDMSSNLSFLTKKYEVKIGDRVYLTKDKNIKIHFDDNETVNVAVRGISYFGLKTNWITKTVSFENIYNSYDEICDITYEDNVFKFTGLTYAGGLEEVENYKIFVQLVNTIDDSEVYSTYARLLDNPEATNQEYSFIIHDSIFLNSTDIDLKIVLSIINEKGEKIHSKIITDVYKMDRYFVQGDKAYQIKNIEGNYSIKELKDYILIDDLYFYGEYLHLKGFKYNEGNKNSISGLKVKVSGETQLQFENSISINDSLFLPNIEIGKSYLDIDDKDLPILYNVDDIFDFYTVTRNNKNKYIQIVNEDYRLTFNAEYRELPEDVYDIIIDPGHGGLDPGACFVNMCERELNLELALMLKEELEEAGLKVQLTREDNDEHSHEENFDLRPYVSDGRVEKVFKSNAKYVISNHLNSTSSVNNYYGYEVYSSYYSNNNWAEIISDDLSSVWVSSNKEKDKVSDGVYNVLGNCDAQPIDDDWCKPNERDYYYMIRETGGKATGAYKIFRLNENINERDMLFGKDSVLIEFAYLSNPLDREVIRNKKEELINSIVRSTLNYLDIE